jgi:hypothetical protein
VIVNLSRHVVQHQDEAVLEATQAVMSAVSGNEDFRLPAGERRGSGYALDANGAKPGLVGPVPRPVPTDRVPPLPPARGLSDIS